jgi:hypothetical protein
VSFSAFARLRDIIEPGLNGAFIGVLKSR